MARPLRINIKGGLYHITSRGNERKKIYSDDADRVKFLETLGEAVDRYEWICHSYCLMDNHYHLLIETPGGNLSQGMRQLNGVYTQYFNKRKERSGHLFQGRFKAIIVEKDTHLLGLVKYVVLNPVKAKICKSAGGYQWSSYRATIGEEKRPHFLFTDWILKRFGENRGSAVRSYVSFVNKESSEKPWDSLVGQIYLGSKEFIENLTGSSDELEEVPRIQRQPFRPELSELLKDKKGILKAYKEHGYTMKDIAKHLNVHYATVSRRLRRLELVG